MPRLTAADRQNIKRAAEKTAQMFVDEFGEPLDPRTTDWDGVAWEMDSEVVSEELVEAGWPVYQKALIAATKRLARKG